MPGTLTSQTNEISSHTNKRSSAQDLTTERLVLVVGVGGDKHLQGVDKEMLERGIEQTDPEVAATIISESIGAILTQRREARARGDETAASTLTGRLRHLQAVRDRIHSGDNEAIGSVLSGAIG